MQIVRATLRLTNKEIEKAPKERIQNKSEKTIKRAFRTFNESLVRRRSKIEYGYDFIVLNRLKLTLGASLGTTFGGYQVSFAKMKDRASIYYEESTLKYDNYARSRILGAYCFGLKLGVGFIPF